ncbi:hypothetical protein [Streptomyces sp. BRA346]
MAELAVQAAVERIERPETEPRSVALPPQLVVRHTTKTPKEVA